MAATNIVMPYVHFRLEELPLPAKVAWVPFFLLKAAWYIVVDRFDRARFNRIFYRNYRGREIETKQELGRRCFEGYLKPKLFPQARARIEELKEQGFEVVLVTGNLNFLMAPLVEELGINHLLAAELEADNGRFTGELKGMPVSDIEKAKRVLKFAEMNDISLDESYGELFDFLASVGDAQQYYEIGVSYLRQLRLDLAIESVGAESGSRETEFVAAFPTPRPSRTD